MCQLDWAMRWPDIWSNIILVASVKVFLDECNISIGRLSKADCLRQCGWASSKQLKAWIEQRGSPLHQARENTSYLMAFQLGHWLFSCLWTGTKTSWILRLLELQTGLIPTTLLILRPLDLEWNETTGSPGSPGCQLTLWMLGLANLHNCMSQFLIINLFIYKCTHTYIHAHLHWFSEEAELIHTDVCVAYMCDFTGHTAPWVSSPETLLYVLCLACEHCL